MEDFLKKLNMSFNTYIMGVYNGHIWADEYMLGALGKMYNIRISVVSPFLSDVWNIFHDGTEKVDVVLIANGMDFIGVKYPITHFSATKGAAKEWKCVGHNIQLREIGLFTGETDGRRTAVDLFNITENKNILDGTKKAVSAINQLCEDVENICIDRDKVLDELKRLKVKVKSYKRLTSYFVEDIYDDGLRKTKSKSTMPEAKKITKIAPSAIRAIPKITFADSRETEVGERLVGEALEILDDDSELMEIRRSAESYSKQREREKKYGTGAIPKTVQILEEGEIPDEIVQQEIYHSFESTDIQTATDDQKLSQLEGHKKKKDKVKVPSEVSNPVKDSERLVQQRRCRVKMPMIGRPKPGDSAPSLPSLGHYKEYLDTHEDEDNVQTKRTYESSRPLEVEAVPIVSQPTHTAAAPIVAQPTCTAAAPIVAQPTRTAGIEFVDTLHDDTHLEPHTNISESQCTSEFQESITVVPDDDFSDIQTEDIFPADLESIINVPFTDLTGTLQQPAIHEFGKVQLDETVKQKKDYLPQNVQPRQKIAIKQEPEASDSDDISITKVEPGTPRKVKKEVQRVSVQQPQIRIISTDNTDKELQRRIKIIAEVHQPKITVAQSSMLDQ